MQLTINFNAGLVESYRTCREYVAARVHQQGKAVKLIAADMDYSPTDLSRKLSSNPDDPRRLSLDDLERYIEVTGDTQPVYYLVEKYLIGTGDEISALEERLAYLKQERKVASVEQGTA